ncbi:MAG: hypothetical protein MI864_23235 [Pseudomonadales bacterium]|nr:hypothetical protein [Pseudomonadales bacterium]
MTDSNLLNMIALRHKSEVTRMDAINNPQLTDSETLKSALSDPNESVRLTAARKLDDDLIWTQLVMDDPHYMVRYFAVEKSTDEATLVKIALHDEDDYIREAAVSNPHLKDQSVLERLAQNDRDESIRKLAQSKIERLGL